MNPSIDKGYALTFIDVIRHIVTRLDGAAPAALSISDLASDYKHYSSDLHRVKLHHDLVTDADANRFLIECGIDSLKDELVAENGGYKLAKPVDKIRYEGRPVQVIVNPHEKLRDPFDPMSGTFHENIRHITDKDSMDELRDSMRNFGWVKDLPAVVDERGTIIMGHRRMEVAKELGIEPNVKVVKFGEGDAADAERFKLAIASNIAAKPLTPTSRKKVSEYLYHEQGWSLTRIAEALKVSITTIFKDIREEKAPPKKPGPKGQVLSEEDIEYGRHVMATKPRDEALIELYAAGWTLSNITPLTDISRALVGRIIRDNNTSAPKERTGSPKATPEQEAAIVKLYFTDDKTRDEVAAEVGLGKTTVQTIIEQERGRREGRREVETEIEAKAEEDAVIAKAVDSVPASSIPETCTCHCGHTHTKRNV